MRPRRPFDLLQLVPLLATLAGCDLLTGPRLPAGAQRFTPPPVYARWWELTEECSGRTGRMSDVTWYVVPDANEIESSSGPADGIWYSHVNDIVFARDANMQGDIVRHEMLHALLGVRGHPRDAFLGRCRGVVDCAGSCITDGGPAPASDPNALRVAPDSLDITVEVTPTLGDSAIMDSAFMMIVFARNRLNVPVSVHLPPSGDAGPPVTFGYHLRSGITSAWGTAVSVWFNVRADVEEDTLFAAGETKRMVFDFRKRSVQDGVRYDLPPGTWEFGGSYGDVSADHAPVLTVLPRSAPPEGIWP